MDLILFKDVSRFGVAYQEWVYPFQFRGLFGTTSCSKGALLIFAPEDFHLGIRNLLRMLQDKMKKKIEKIVEHKCNVFTSSHLQIPEDFLGN